MGKGDASASLPGRGDERRYTGGSFDPRAPGYETYTATVDGVKSGKISRAEGDRIISKAREGGTGVAESAGMLASAIGEKGKELVADSGLGSLALKLLVGYVVVQALTSGVVKGLSRGRA